MLRSARFVGVWRPAAIPVATAIFILESESYLVSIMRDSLDWINVMAYDFKGPSWSNVSTGAPAGLYDPG